MMIMMMMKGAGQGVRLFTYSLAFVFAMVIAASAATSFQAQVDNPAPSVGERITYTVTLATDISLPDITPPDFDGFDIIAGPSVSTSVQIVNMSVSKSKSVTYVLRATRPGSLVISAAKAVIKKSTFTSNVVRVEVTQPGMSGATQSQPSRGGRSGQAAPTPNVPSSGGRSPEVFLTASTDKPSLYKLDMATITYRLYLRVSVLNYELTRTPQATGFWMEEFPTSNRPILEDVTIKGEPYKVAVIRRIGLFPTRTGSLILDPLTIDVTVEQPAARRSRDPFDAFFNDPFFNRASRQVKSATCDPINLTVRDLPAGAPPSFGGDVGNYDLKVTYDKSEASQNDALGVKVTISGKGYLKSIDAPKLNLPSGFEAFKPTEDNNITVSGDAMRGRKTFSYLVIPRRSGSFTLPPVTWSYFDPDDGHYKTLSEGGIALNVTPSAGGSSDALIGGRAPSEVQMMDSDIRFIKAISGPLDQTTVPPYRSQTYFLLLALAPLLFFGGIGYEKYDAFRHSDPVAVRRRKALAEARKAFEEAAKLSQAGQALKTVETAARGLSEVVGAVIDEPTAGLTSSAIATALALKGAGEELVKETLRLLSEADRIRYGGAGSSSSDIERLLDNFRNTVDALEKVK